MTTVDVKGLGCPCEHKSRVISEIISGHFVKPRVQEIHFLLIYRKHKSLQTFCVWQLFQRVGSTLTLVGQIFFPSPLPFPLSYCLRPFPFRSSIGLSFPHLSLLHTYSSPFLSLPLEVGLLNTVRGSGEQCKGGLGRSPCVNWIWCLTLFWWHYFSWQSCDHSVCMFLLHMKRITPSTFWATSLHASYCLIVNVLTFGGARSRPKNVNRENCAVLWIVCSSAAVSPPVMPSTCKRSASSFTWDSQVVRVRSRTINAPSPS